jgi:hypothetical protein
MDDFTFNIGAGALRSILDQAMRRGRGRPRFARSGRETSFHCIDCGVDTLEIHKYYTVENEVWASACADPGGGKLCIGCLELRLGRTLLASDFSAFPVNDPNKYRMSSRLRARLKAVKVFHEKWEVFLTIEEERENVTEH